MFARPDYPRLSAEEFMRIDFGELKAELDDGVVRIVAGATARQAQVQGNILTALTERLRGTGYAPYNSAMPVRTHDRSIRRPDVAVYHGRAGPENDDFKMFDDPRVIFEVLSSGTARTNLREKLDEYKAMPSVDTIVFVDIATERLRVVQRTGPGGWSDERHADLVDLPLPSIGATLPHRELFARR